MTDFARCAGPSGPTGIRGLAGCPGPSGPCGSPGSPGGQGERGDPGPAGSQIYSGEECPPSDTLGREGDYFLSIPTRSLFFKVPSSSPVVADEIPSPFHGDPKASSHFLPVEERGHWEFQLSLQGCPGMPGSPGIPGTPGQPGATGPAGAPGPPGGPGPTGPPGFAGPSGPVNSDVATGFYTPRVTGDNTMTFAPLPPNSHAWIRIGQVMTVTGYLQATRVQPFPFTPGFGTLTLPKDPSEPGARIPVISSTFSVRGSGTAAPDNNVGVAFPLILGNFDVGQTISFFILFAGNTSQGRVYNLTYSFSFQTT